MVMITMNARKGLGDPVQLPITLGGQAQVEGGQEEVGTEVELQVLDGRDLRANDIEEKLSRRR